MEKQCYYEICLTEPIVHPNCPWDSILKSEHQKDPPFQNTLLSQIMRDEKTQAEHISFLSQLGSKQCTSECLPWNGFHGPQCWLWAFNCMQASTNLKCGKGPRNLSPKTNAWNSTTLSIRTWRLPNNRLGQPWHIWCFSKSPVGMTHTSLCSWQAPSFYTEDQESPKNSVGQWGMINNFKIWTIFPFTRVGEKPYRGQAAKTYLQLSCSSPVATFCHSPGRNKAP